MEINFLKNKDYAIFTNVIRINLTTYLKMKVYRYNTRDVKIKNAYIYICHGNSKSNIVTNSDVFLNITLKQLKEKFLISWNELKTKIKSNYNIYDYVINDIILEIDSFRKSVINENITDVHNYTPKVYFSSPSRDKTIYNIYEKISDNILNTHDDSISFNIYAAENVCVSEDIKFYINITMMGCFNKKGKRIKQHESIGFMFINNFYKYISTNFYHKNIENFLRINVEDFIPYMKTFEKYHDCKWFNDVIKNQDVKNVIQKTFTEVRKEYIKTYTIAPKEIKNQNTFYKGA